MRLKRKKARAISLVQTEKSHPENLFRMKKFFSISVQTNASMQNHIIGAITDEQDCREKRLDCQDIFQSKYVEIPSGYGDRVLKAMADAKS
jgi:hypothetical protein